MTQTIGSNVGQIRAEAIEAARNNQPPLQACRYPFGSPGGLLWMQEFTKEINRLQRNDRRARAADQGDAP